MKLEEFVVNGASIGRYPDRNYRTDGDNLYYTEEFDTDPIDITHTSMDTKESIKDIFNLYFDELLKVL